MSFIYPRTVSISRPRQETGIGAMPYGGQVPANEELMLSGLRASIQLKKSGGGNEAALPGDAGKTMWRVLIPRMAAPRGAIKTRDIVTDDLGVRYQVVGPYWNSLGHNLLAERLEA